MLKGLRIPTHTVDAPGVFIFAHDAAWDLDRINLELEVLRAAALDEVRVTTGLEPLAVALERLERERVEVGGLTEEEIAEETAAVELTDDARQAAEDRHPWHRYRAGVGRYDLDAEDQGPHGRVTPRSYLREGVDPTFFYLRRVKYKERGSIEIDNDAMSRWSRWIVAGVERIVTGAEVVWEPTKKAPRMPDSIVEALSTSEGGTLNLITLAGVCSKFSGPITEAEGKR